ncbi:TIGR00303 family protein [Synechococcus sp. CS-1325]|nr:TIGR00303 family protein [Synechococcus sp. CS-1325]PZV00514.1 MAG: TIGR00303 family protein [Cyanobium sp.]
MRWPTGSFQSCRLRSANHQQHCAPWSALIPSEFPSALSGDPVSARSWCERLRAGTPDAQLLLLLAGTQTAEVAGISAAGATAASRRLTAAADAELLLRGPGPGRCHALPPLPAGVSPALISHVVRRELALETLVVDLGCPVMPAVPHLRLGQLPARCLSTGAAMAPERVSRLVQLGESWARGWARRPGQPPLVLAECVPGGTSTAQAVLSGLGIEAAGLVSGSLRQPAHALKASLVEQGLRAAELWRLPSGEPVDPLRVVAAVGDPMQPLAAGLVLAAAAAEIPVLLAGGSQMAAVLALALALAPDDLRPGLVAGTALVTTAWVAGEPGSDLSLLLQRIGSRWRVEPIAFATGLRFHGCRSRGLRDYERGYVKEGVGAGGLALLWELSGRRLAQLSEACDLACEQLEGCA